MTSGKTMDMEKQLLMERSSRCRVLGKKYGTLFGISVLEVISFVVLQVIAWHGLIGASLPVLQGSAVALGLVTIAVTVIFGTTVFSLGKYYDGFKSSGWLYVIYQGLTVYSYMTSGVGRPVFSFLASLFGIFYIMSFSSAMEESFDQVDEKMRGTWVLFKKVFLVMQIGQYINYLAVLGTHFARFFWFLYLAMNAAGIVIRIWQFILLGESSSAMDKYVNSPS